MSDKKIISQKDVKKVAELARIAITSEEGEKFAKEISEILQHFKSLDEVEVSDFGKIDHYGLIKNQLRNDDIEDVTNKEKEAIRSLFPQRKGDYLRAKAVLGNSE